MAWQRRTDMQQRMPTSVVGFKPVPLAAFAVSEGGLEFDLYHKPKAARSRYVSVGS